MATRIGSSKKAKHIELKHLFIQQLVPHDLVRIIKINTANNTADIFTKYVPTETLLRHLNDAGLTIEASQRCWAHNPALLATAATNNSFTAASVLTCERVYTVRTTCAANTHRHTFHSHGADNGQQHRQKHQYIRTTSLCISTSFFYQYTSIT